jgi:glycosyltransferase involved in cell wall biosynthesis
VPRVRRVALNALFLAPGESGGPETYLRGLVPALAREFPQVEMDLFTTGSGARALESDGWAHIVRLHALPTEEHRRLRRQLSEQVLLPVAAVRNGAELLHNLASTGPISTPRLRAVLTLHDVTFMRVATFGRATTWGMTRIVSLAARDADALITGAAAARDEICAALGLAPADFQVVPHGVSLNGSGRPEGEDSVRAALGLDDRRLVLCVGALRPHKNQELLVRAAALLDDDVRVLLVGHQEEYAQRLGALARDLGVADRVLMLGWLADGRLERLWSMAACAAFPTRGEGFGLPLAEAMARGVPVACSDIPVLREVGGEVPAYFDPDDPRSAADAIATCLGDPARGGRGRERAERFTWERAAQGTMEAYERAMAF